MLSTRQVQFAVKRLIDIVASVVGLILLGPVLLVLAAVIRIKLGGPVFFRQERPGLNAKPFKLIKFRTMTDARDEQGKLLPDDQRLAALGRFLRSTSMDELPEFFNVMKGDMSLVGPRPLMMKYLARYTPEQARRHEVKPGITGWAQVNGRNAISWEDKFNLDVWYVDNWGVWLDLKIILKSIAMVVRRKDVAQDGRATVDEFMGTGQGLQKK
jgi:sugar transferase EpsL